MAKYCEMCGNEILDEQIGCLKCNNQEVQLENKKKSKKLVITISIIVFVLSIILVSFIVFTFINSSAKGYYDNNKWGTTYDDICEKYGDDISESYLNEDALALFYTKFNGIEGIYVMVQFEFDNDEKLNNVLLMVSNAQSEISDIELLDMIIEAMNDDYGDYEEVSYGYSWETKESIIAVKQYPGSPDGVMIMYNPK